MVQCIDFKAPVKLTSIAVEKKTNFLRGCKIGQTILPKKTPRFVFNFIQVDDYRMTHFNHMVSPFRIRHFYYSCLFRSQNSLTLPRIPRDEGKNVHFRTACLGP